MSEIPRWTPKYLTSWEESGAMSPAVHGGYVDYTDHVAALKTARNELPDVGSWSPPAAKFKVGDRVLLDEQPEILVITGILSSQSVASDWSYDVCTTTGMPVTRVSASRLDLYTPPTPTELIPTLKEHEWVRGVWENGETLREHEWVRGTYKTGIAFGPCSVYYNEIGAMFAGDNNLIHWNTGRISDKLATLERCDAPEVK